MEQKIQQTLQILEEYASEKKFVNYNDLYRQIGLNTENPADRNTGSQILGEVSKITLEKNKTMLSAIITLRGDQTPAYGFYDLATELGLLKETADEKEKIGFWVKQVKKVLNAYDKQ